MTTNDESPCKACDRKDKDKRVCSKICDRLEAWQDEDPAWDTFRIPTPEEVGETDDGNQKTGQKICKHDGCDAPAKCRGFCLKHYDMWRHGKLPGYPPFEATQTHKPKGTAPKNTRKKATPKKPNQQPGAETASEVFQFTVDLTDYPDMRDMIRLRAARYLVSPQHVIVSLIGEALAARLGYPVEVYK